MLGKHYGVSLEIGEHKHKIWTYILPSDAILLCLSLRLETAQPKKYLYVCLWAVFSGVQTQKNDRQWCDTQCYFSFFLL